MITTTTYHTLISAEERAALAATWRTLYATRHAATFDFLLYALLRGKDPRSGFTPISNPRKLANGCTAEQSYRTTLLAASNIAGHRLSEKLSVLFPSMAADRKAQLCGGIWHAATELYYGKKGA